MTITELTQLRLHNQQLLDPSFKRPADVVRWSGALQSQDLASCLYAIGLRMQGGSEALVEQAIADRSIVRSWPMRRTIHCMPAEDARWMVRLLAPRQNARMASYYRKAGITKGDLKRAGKVLDSALAGGKQLTRFELYRELNAAHIATSAAAGAMRGLHILVHWAQAGLICGASRRGKQPTFALFDEWVPPGRDLSGDEALAELARRYFQSHGPATARDFAWWAGLTMAEARQGLRLIVGSLEPLTIQGVEYWLTRDACTARQSSKTSVFLLPAFDEYTVAYADRSAAANEAVLRQINHGISANIIINGRIAGTWQRKLSRNTVLVTYKPLRRLTGEERAGLTRAVDEYGKFVGRRASISI
jgi:hypothetical protein